MDSTISLSKGCFAFNGQGKKRKKSIQKSTASRELWYKTYDELKQDSSKKQNEFYSEVHTSFFAEIVDFVKRSGECWANGSVSRVPAAMVLTGMALADYTQIFSILTTKLKEDVTPHIAMLKGKECPSLKVAVESVVQQFTSVLQPKPKVAQGKRFKKAKNNCDSSDSELSEEDEDDDVVVKGIKRGNLNFPALIKWYNTLSNDKEPKSKPLAIPPKPLIIIVSDVEGSSPSVLQDLIYISKNYLEKLPLVFLFSIATAPSLLTRYISDHALSCLTYTFIQSPPTFDVFPDMVKKVILSRDSLFMVGGKVLKLLVHTFNFLDNSLSGFMRMYQFCLMEHFYANPVRSLCCPLSEVKSVLKTFTNADLEELRQLPSFRKYVEDQPPKERAPLLLNDSHLKKTLVTLMSDLHARIWEFRTGVEVLNVISSNLPTSPFGFELYETYIKSTTKDVCSSTDFEEALKLLKLLSKDEFLKKFQAIHHILEDSAKNCPGSGSVIEGVLNKMKQSLDKIAERDQENSKCSISPRTLRSPQKSVGRVLQDSLSENSLKSPTKCIKSDVLGGIKECKVVIESTKLCGTVSSHQSKSPRKSVGNDQLKGKIASPLGSPEAGVRTSVPNSPGKRTPGRLLKMLKDNPSASLNSSPKEVAKEPVVDLDFTVGKLDRNQLRERLLTLSKQSRETVAKEEAKWEVLKGEVLESLKKVLVLSLGEGPNPLMTFPLYEVIMFEDAVAVRSHLIPPSPQAALHSALINPRQYLECKCCELPDNSSILPTLPDVCIAYKLHLECGRMINLYDWLQAFNMILNSHDGDSKEDQVDIKVQARFMQAVADLQFTGFIKPTKRKADHVVRLTWGGLS